MRYVLQHCDYRDTARRLRLLPADRRQALCLTSPPYDRSDGHKSYCPPGGLVWDPFAGACTVLAEALRRGHTAVGSEVCGAYFRELGHTRLRQAIRVE